jgi:hypothetical protein
MAIHAPITGAQHCATTFQPQRGTRYRRLLATLSSDEIGMAIDALIARLDAAAGDSDLEHDGIDEPDGDEQDSAWFEFADAAPAWCRVEGHEDDEPSDVQLLHHHRARIRRRSCLEESYGVISRYVLADATAAPLCTAAALAAGFVA